MNKIRPESPVYQNLYIQRNRSEKAEAAGKPAVSAFPYGRKGTGQLNTDRISSSSSSELLPGKEITELFRNLLEQVKKDCPGIYIAVEKPETDGERDLLSEVLDQVGDGYALILSDEFMAGIYAGKDSYKKKAQAVLECVRRLGKLGAGAGVWLEEDQAVFLRKESEADPAAEWVKRVAAGRQEYGSLTGVRGSLTEAWGIPQPFGSRGDSSFADQIPSPAEQMLRKFRIGSSSPYQTAASYSRMARASSRSMVLNVMQETRRNIATLKLLAVYGDEKDQKKAKAALRSLEKLLLRCNKKLQRFNEESLTETRIKRAAEREQEEKEIQARLELKRRKTSRATGDGAIRKEGQLDALTIPGYRPARHGRYDPERRAYVEMVPMSPAAGIPLSGGAAGFSGASGSVAASPCEGYVVSDVMSF